jgi:hypothetical protein
VGDCTPEQAGGVFKSLEVQPQLLLQCRVQGGVSARFAVGVSPDWSLRGCLLSCRTALF